MPAVIAWRGNPRAVLIGVRDYVRLAAPEVLRIIGRESEARGKDRLSARQIEKIIRKTRKKKSTRR